MLRILVVAYDESPISPLVAQIETDGYSVVVLEDERSRDLIVQQWPFDLVVVNWSPPEILPLVASLIRLPQVRAEKNSALLVLTRCIRDEAVVPDIPVGVHQHIMKPLPIHDLLDRVRGLMASARASNLADHIVAGDIRLDRKSQTVFRGKRRINLAALPFRVLEALMSDAGRVLLAGIWRRRSGAAARMSMSARWTLKSAEFALC